MQNKNDKNKQNIDSLLDTFKDIAISNNIVSTIKGGKCTNCSYLFLDGGTESYSDGDCAGSSSCDWDDVYDCGG